MARSRKSGQRTKSGRLSRAAKALAERNPPSESVIARQDRFRHFRGEGSIGLEMTCAGRLMLVGALDGLEVPAETLLDEILKYQHAYWGNYASCAPGISAYEFTDRSHDNGWADPAGKWFDEQDKRLREAGHAVRQAVIDVSVDRHFFPDEDVGWASRIINSRIVQKREQLVKAKRPVPDGLTVCGEMACDSDWAMLELLRSGAMALAGMSLRRAA